MSKNVCVWDRALRVLVGLGLVAAVLMGSVGPWGWIGIIFVVTGLVGFCPIYKLLGYCKKDCSSPSDCSKNDSSTRK
jgi:Protein of unknown function (DUF2892)